MFQEIKDNHHQNKVLHYCVSLLDLNLYKNDYLFNQRWSYLRMKWIIIRLQFLVLYILKYKNIITFYQTF